MDSTLSTSSSSSSSSSTQMDLLVEAYRKTQQPTLDDLTTKKNSLQSRQNFFSQLKTKIDALVSNIDSFKADNAASKFVTRSVTSSNSAVLTATATSDALIGIGSVKVNRLASNDILITQRLATDGTFGVTGSQTFKINGKEVTVNIDPGATNESVMKSIVTAINNTKDVNVTATYIKDTSTTGRITLTATNTGTDNKIGFDDNGSGVLNQLGLNNVDPNATNRTPTQGDNQYAHYKIADNTQLNSELDINGVTVTRGSNAVNDILPGITLNLLKPQETSEMPVTVTAAVDSGAVENVINPLLNSFNDLVKFFRANQPTLRSEPSVSSLYSKLRTLSSQAVTSADPGNPQYLMDIGVKIANDGTLSITDHTKLTNMLATDPSKVADLFVSSDGIAGKLQNFIANYVGDNNIIQSKKLSLSKQLESNAKQTTDAQSRIDRAVEALKKEYTSTLQTMLEAQNQYSMFQSTSMLSTSTTA